MSSENTAAQWLLDLVPCHKSLRLQLYVRARAHFVDPKKGFSVHTQRFYSSVDIHRL